MLEKLKALIDGKKSYIVIGVAIVIAGLQAAGVIVTVPEYVWQLLGLLGLGAARSALGKVGK